MANLWCLTLVMVDETEPDPRWIDGSNSLETDVVSKTKDTPWELYVASAYFTSYTLTSVGYGDIGPKNIVERVVCVFMLILSGICWTIVLEESCTIVAKMDVDEQCFRKSMDKLNIMMDERELPTVLRHREYFLSHK